MVASIAKGAALRLHATPKASARTARADKGSAKKSSGKKGSAKKAAVKKTSAKRVATKTTPATKPADGTRARKVGAARSCSKASKAREKPVGRKITPQPAGPDGHAAGVSDRATQAVTGALVAEKSAEAVAPKRAASIGAKPRSLVQRVYNTIDGELAKLEQQKGLTSQDRERASRALSQMVNALEKAVDMQRQIAKTKSSGGDAKSKEALAHAEDLRREIADRLERLNRKRATGRRSE